MRRPIRLSGSDGRPLPRDRGVYAGDLDGLNRVYTETSRLIPESGETTIQVFLGFDVGAFATWRPVFSKHIFSAYTKPRKTRLNVTTHRIVLVREIDGPRRSIPSCSLKDSWPRTVWKSGWGKSKAQHGHYYCVIRPPELTLAHSSARRGTLFAKLLGEDGSKYAVFFHTDPADPQAIPLIKRQFRPIGSRM